MTLFCFVLKGIGYEVTKWIAMLGGTVVMACRSEDDAMKVMQF